jgi:hypothetical protein
MTVPNQMLLSAPMATSPTIVQFSGRKKPGSTRKKRAMFED